MNHFKNQGSPHLDCLLKADELFTATDWLAIPNGAKIVHSLSGTSGPTSTHLYTKSHLWGSSVNTQQFPIVQTIYDGLLVHIYIYDDIILMIWVDCHLISVLK